MSFAALSLLGLIHCRREVPALWTADRERTLQSLAAEIIAGTPAPLGPDPGTDVCRIIEYGLSQPLSRAIRCF